MDRNEVLKGLRKCKQSQCEYTHSQMYTKAYTNLHRSMAGDQTRTVIPSHFPYSVVCVEGFLKSQLSHLFGMLRASIFLFSHSPFFPHSLPPLLFHPPIVLAVETQALKRVGELFCGRGRRRRKGGGC